jgi:hypothetical protein
MSAAIGDRQVSKSLRFSRCNQKSGPRPSLILDAGKAATHSKRLLKTVEGGQRSRHPAASTIGQCRRKKAMLDSNQQALTRRREADGFAIGISSGGAGGTQSYWCIS